MKRFPWFEILLVAIIMGISLYAALSDSQNLSQRWFTRDDAYYYFKVAQNISEGHGSTFDGINPTNGYHPLWMLVCIPIFALARFDLILPLRVLLMVLGGLSVGTAILFYRLIGRVFSPPIGAIAAFYWAFNYNILVRVYQQGLETGIAVFFVVLLIYQLFKLETSWRKEGVSNRQLLTMGLIALLAALSRLDLIFLGVMVGAWIIFRASPLRHFLLLDVAGIVISVLLAFIARLSFNEYYRFADAALVMAAVSLVVKIPLAYFLGLYQSSVLTNPKKLAAQLVIFLGSGSGLVTVLMLILSNIGHFEGFPRITVAYDLVFTLLFIGGIRFAALGLKTGRSRAPESASPLAYINANWKPWFNEGLSYYGVLGGGMLIYMIFNKIMFGTFSPVSGQIKRWWGSLSGQVYGGSVSDALSFFGIRYRGDANAWFPASTLFHALAVKTNISNLLDNNWYLIILFLVALLYYLLLYTNKQKAKSAITQLGIVPLFASSWFQVLYYHAPGYASYKNWYWVSQLATIALVFGMVLGLLYHAVRKAPYANVQAWVIAGLFGCYMLFPFWNGIHSNMKYKAWKPTAPNNDLAAFLEAHTEPGSIIGLTGGGNAAYFIHDRTVINMDGLINSYNYFQLLKERKAGTFLANEGMNYILANTGILNQLPYKGQFAPYSEWMDVHYGGKDLVRYHPDAP